MTRLIFEAISTVGCRALVSKGWGGLGAEDVGLPDGVFMLGNVPHDWLFEHVSVVVHHGGAGTTAAGIKAGKPTFVVPFFGDQPFWGAMIARAGAGPDPIPYKQLTAVKLASAVKHCLLPVTLNRARELGNKISQERGVDLGGQSFHHHLDIDSMRCSLAPSRVAVWRVRRSQIRLSALTADVLVKSDRLSYQDLKPNRSREYNTEAQPWDPITACVSSLTSDIGGMVLGVVADMPRVAYKATTSQIKKDKSPSSPPLEDITHPDNTTDFTEPQSFRASHKEAVVNKAVSASSCDMEGTISGQATPIGQSSAPFRQSGTVESSAGQAGLSAIPPPLTPFDPARIENALNITQEVNRLVIKGARTPMNACLGLAKGFRNAPRLYNDETIRPIEKVTGLTSGLRVAGKEFGFGMYDGISGLITHPWNGAKTDGGLGFLKGVGKGIGGAFLKPAGGRSQSKIFLLLHKSGIRRH